MVKKSLSRIYLAIIFLFLYLPIGVLIVLSFNNSLSRVKWGGFTTEWYRNLVSDPTIMNAFYTTILITVASSVIATIIGTMAAIGISAMRKRNRQIMLGATNIPLLNARYCNRYFPDAAFCPLYSAWNINRIDCTYYL